MGPIFNAKDKLLNQNSGTVPSMSSTLRNYFQSMIFVPVTKTVNGGLVVETEAPINTAGVIQPFSAQKLMMKPEGQRSWKWHLLHAEPGLTLSNDDVIQYLGLQYRVMERFDYSLYGYVEYHLVEDFSGAGPVVS